MFYLVWRFLLYLPHVKIILTAMKKITLFFVILMMSTVAFNAAASSNLRGDVNGNNVVDISDVTALIGYVLTGNGSSLVLANADCTLNGVIDISDVTCLIDYVLRGAWPEPPHEWVDLGLPSGTLWATCNVGANSPEEYGDHFAWGETAPKDYYGLSTYKWCNSNYYTLTKYCINSDYGMVDNKTELDPEDDAAYVNWGPSWRMPTHDQQLELIYNCAWTNTQQNGVNGSLAKGPNGNTVFLPAAGIFFLESLSSMDGIGIYWSRSLACHFNPSESTYYTWDAYWLGFNMNGVDDSEAERWIGLSVRAVRVSQN